MSDYAREEITAFLANKDGYAPASGEINGILKQMMDTMNKDLAEATAAEELLKVLSVASEIKAVVFFETLYQRFWIRFCMPKGIFLLTNGLNRSMNWIIL